jgi:hypothetical protein
MTMVMKHSLTALPLMLLVVIAVMQTTFVYAQTNTTTTPEEESTITAPTNATGNTTTSAPIQLVTPSAVAQQIINNTQAECEQAQFSPRKCVILVYESPTTIVLNGDVLIFGGSAESIGRSPNSFLWKAVDGFKAQGYTITTIGISGAGNKSNPNEFQVIMSK